MMKTLLKQARNGALFALLSLCGLSAVLADEVIDYTEGANLRVNPKQGTLTVSNRLECPVAYCEVLTMTLPSEVEVEDATGTVVIDDENHELGYDDLVEWGTFHGEVEYTRDDDNNYRVRLVVRSERPSES